MSTLLLVAVGGGAGALLRFLTDRTVQAHHDTVFPWGTFTVNALGSLLLGFLVTGVSEAGVSRTALALFGTGLCGALTTYSTFSYETFQLAQQGARFFAVVNVLATVATTLGMVSLGRTVALAVWS